MAHPHEIRRLAMQALYQIDLAGPGSEQELADRLDEEHDDPWTRAAGVTLALHAWAMREEADAAISALTPDWPTHRQPPIDRALLRLAYYEMRTQRVPLKVAINEAVQLSKEYASEHSPPFINGVLDKLAKRWNTAHVPDQPVIPPPPPPPTDPQAWLSDALGGKIGE